MQYLLPAAVTVLFPVERRVCKLTEELIRETRTQERRGARTLLKSMAKDFGMSKFPFAEIIPIAGGIKKAHRITKERKGEQVGNNNG